MKKSKLMPIIILVLVVVLAGAYFVGSKGNKSSEESTDQSSANGKIPKVGVLQYVSHPALDEIYRGIKAGLKKSGYEDGKTVDIELLNGQADQSKLATMSQQLISDDSDVLIVIATPAAQALANETKSVPIVLGAITDPVSAGLVKSNKKPGGNITGVSDKSPVAAQMDLATKILPDAKKMGILYSSAEDNSDYQAKQVKKAAEEKGLTVALYAVPSANEITQMVQVMANEVDFIYIPTDNTIANAMQTVVEVANKTNTPIIPSVDTMVEQGGLATVGINQYKLGVKTGQMTADILKGKSKPATTPVYTFDSGDVIVNEKQAEKLGITIPEDVLKEAKIVGE